MPRINKTLKELLGIEHDRLSPTDTFSFDVHYNSHAWLLFAQISRMVGGLELDSNHHVLTVECYGDNVIGLVIRSSRIEHTTRRIVLPNDIFYSRFPYEETVLQHAKHASASCQNSLAQIKVRIEQLQTELSVMSTTALHEHRKVEIHEQNLEHARRLGCTLLPHNELVALTKVVDCSSED